MILNYSFLSNYILVKTKKLEMFYGYLCLHNSTFICLNMCGKNKIDRAIETHDVQ
jgi:hypothetical protein